MTCPVATIQVPPQWEDIARQLPTGPVMVIGAVNSGKSTFVRWLTGELRRRGEVAGWLDADTGQSTLGLPATMNLARVRKGDFPPIPEAVFFTGSISPRGHMLPALVGVQLLKERAEALGVDALVVDTSGLVEREGGGGALKEWKIALLRPAVVVALQREGELEHILGPLRREKRLTLHVLPVAETVRPRSREERAERRRRQFADHFSKASEVRVSLGGLPVYGLEKAGKGRLLSFQDEGGFSLGLGVVAGVGRGIFEVVTPLGPDVQPAGLRVGELRLDPETGEEI
jgi:polynucleotide 5'-hydroxyl-kinase GRC3/NOL9